MRTGGCLIRFRTPTTTRSKQKRLSISEQPFGVGKVCNEACRYRFHCILYANGLKDIGEAGPICRSLTWDYPEFSLNKDSYSEEFQVTNYAKDSGLQGYLALPILEQRNDRQHQRGSTGVLEILTFTENISLDTTFLEKSKVEPAIRFPPPCRKPEGCRGRSDMRVVGLYPLRDPYNLPLIQVWFPCICTLVQQLRKYNIEFGSTDDQEFSVEFSYMDDVYKAVYYNVHQSARRSGCQELGNGKKDPKVADVQEDDVQRCQIKNNLLGEASKDAIKLEDDKVQSHELRNVREDHEVTTVKEDNVQHYRVKNRQFSEASKATKRLKSEQVQSHEASGSHGEKQWLSLSVQQPNSETAADNKSTQCFPFSVQQPCSETTDDKRNPQGNTESSGEPGSNIRKRKLRKIITQAMIEESFGRRIKDAAAELQVSISTLKRFCRKYGIQNWPSVRMPSGEPCNCGGKEQEYDSRSSPEHKSREKQVTGVNGPGNYNFDHSHFLTVKARYNECLVKFPFSAQSGIEALQEKLSTRFKLEIERIRIEYEDEDGDKVMISCDEDLSYHMHSLSLSGSTRMELSVAPALVCSYRCYHDNVYLCTVHDLNSQPLGQILPSEQSMLMFEQSLCFCLLCRIQCMNCMKIICCVGIVCCEL